MKKPHNITQINNITLLTVNNSLLAVFSLESLVKFLYGLENSHIIYFNNEEPSRVATIIYSIIKHPDLFKLYEKNFS